MMIKSVMKLINMLDDDVQTPKIIQFLFHCSLFTQTELTHLIENIF